MPLPVAQRQDTAPHPARRSRSKIAAQGIQAVILAPGGGPRRKKASEVFLGKPASRIQRTFPFPDNLCAKLDYGSVRALDSTIKVCIVNIPHRQKTSFIDPDLVQVIKVEQQINAPETNELLAFIEQNKLVEGDKLPPERELAIKLGISRRALRHLLTKMELDGHIWRGRRNGTFLGRRSVGPISIDQRIVRGSPASVLETRLAVEPAIAAIAAMKASEADLVNIDTCMRRTTEVRDDDDWIRWDGAFHLAIAKATRNDILVGLVAAFNDARSSGDWLALRLATITLEKRRKTIAHHRTICEMLRKRSAEDASQAMRDHLLTTRRNLFD
jgi:DNA-binding FadR family transcriptional regulator